MHPCGTQLVCGVHQTLPFLVEVGLACETSHEDGSDTKNDPLLSLSIAILVSPQCCRQESPTCMVNTICTLEPEVSRESNTACQPIPFNPALVIHHHILVCPFSLQQQTLLASFPGLETRLQTLPSYLHHSVGLLYLPINSHSCGFHTLLSSIIYGQIHCHTHKHNLCSSYVSTHPSTNSVSGVGCLFLRSAEVLW